MEDHDLLPEGKIRTFCISKRVTNSAGIKLKLPEVTLKNAFIAVFPKLFYIYPYRNETLFSRSAEQATFQLTLQRLCENPEMLFIGELFPDGRICFEGPSEENRVVRLLAMLRQAFGYHPLGNDAMNLTSLNPIIWLGESNLGQLRTLVGTTIEPYPNESGEPARN